MNASWFHMRATSKRIQLKFPVARVLKLLQLSSKLEQQGLSSSIRLEVVRRTMYVHETNLHLCVCMFFFLLIVNPIQL